MRTPLLFLGILAFLLVTACGQQDLTPSHLSDLMDSPDGQTLKAAENECLDLGLRFTDQHQIDSTGEEQAAAERPFLTDSSKMQALEKYIRAAQTMQKTFGTNAPVGLEERQKAALAKSNEIAQRILKKDKNGVGAIVLSENLSKAFLNDSVELVAQEQAMAKAGATFRVSLGPERVTLESETIPTELAKAFVLQSQTFLKRYEHDLASPLVRLKMQALQAKLPVEP